MKYFINKFKIEFYEFVIKFRIEFACGVLVVFLVLILNVLVLLICVLESQFNIHTSGGRNRRRNVARRFCTRQHAESGFA